MLQVIYVKLWKDVNMKGILIGFVLGLIVATVGFGGVARILDNGVSAVKEHSQEYAK